MQGRCTAICISADHGQELDEWVAAVHEQVLEVKVKMRRFREKEMMGRRVGGQSRARLWTYILFSQGPLLYLLFHAPQSAVSRPTALSGGQIVCSPTIYCILSSLKTSRDVWASTHWEGEGYVQIANWSLVRNGCTSPGNGSWFLHSATCGGGNDWWGFNRWSRTL